MAENNVLKKQNECLRFDKSLNENNIYEFDKNIFIVERVFESEHSETLGTVLLRLMTQKG